MKYRLRIYPAASADVDDAALFIPEDNFDAAMRFYDAIEQTYCQIRDHPNRWPRYELDHAELINLHKRAVTGFRNYLVFYLINGNIVDIVRVLHGARDIPSVLTKDLLEG